jgi:secreted Zn-dependent insulinase-like peptidase
LSLLKEKHWVNQLSAGGSVLARGSACFKVVVDLTPDGMKSTDEIILHLFEVHP